MLPRGHTLKSALAGWPIKKNGICQTLLCPPDEQMRREKSVDLCCLKEELGQGGPKVGVQMRQSEGVLKQHSTGRRKSIFWRCKHEGESGVVLKQNSAGCLKEKCRLRVNKWEREREVHLCSPNTGCPKSPAFTWTKDRGMGRFRSWSRTCAKRNVFSYSNNIIPLCFRHYFLLKLDTIDIIHFGAHEVNG